MKIRGSVRIRADAQTIWDYVSEPNNDPAWVDTTPIVDVIGNGMHMEVSFQQKWGKTETWGTAKVEGWDEPNVIVWDVEDGFRRTEVTYFVEPGKFTQINRTRFKKKRWLEPVLYPFIWMQMRKQLRALKNFLER